MAGLLNNFVGHQDNKTWLLNGGRNQQLPSSIIFNGPQGVGKKTLALGLLQALNCPNDPNGCGECSSCNRVLEEKNEIVYNLGLESKSNISVEQVREVQAFFQLKSMHKARFVIIDPADRLSVSASNSLLKVLEESPERTHFILITDQVSRLLPTIRSRSHMLNFAALTQQELMQYSTFNPLSLAWSGGRLAMAQDLEKSEYIDQLNESVQLMYSLLCESPQDWKKRAAWFFNDEAQREFCLQIWKMALQKRLMGESENLEFLPDNTGTISFIFEQVENLEKDIRAHVDKLLATESFYYQVHNYRRSHENPAS